MRHATRFLWFDLVRGISALMVCAGHLRAALIADYGAVQRPTSLHGVFYFITGLGHQAVMIFFVLSGFFVGGSVLRNTTKFSWSRYAVARLTRLWIVLIPALLVTFMIDRLIHGLAPQALAGAFQDVWNSGPKSSHDFSDSFSTFLGNITFLQTIVVPVYGVDGPLWSLSNEFWYYVLFPCFVCAVATSSPTPRLHTRLLFGVAGLSLLAWLSTEMRTGFFIWLLGILVWFVRAVPPPKRYRYILAIAGTLFFGATLVYSKSPQLLMRLGFSADLAVGIGFCVFAVALVWSPAPTSLPEAVTRPIRRLADFSYSLYVVHFPLVLLIAVAFYRTGKVQPDFVGLLHWTAWFGILIIAGIIFWWCFEKRTDALRQTLFPEA